MGSAYRECKSAFGGERWDSRLYSERLQGSYLQVQKVVASHYERPSIEPAPFGGESEAEIWNDTLARTRSLGLRPQVHFSGTVHKGHSTHSRRTLRRSPSDQQARAHCPSDTVVWVNARSHIYHFAGTHNSRSTAHICASMCEQDAQVAGDRAAMNEHHPCVLRHPHGGIEFDLMAGPLRHDERDASAEDGIRTASRIPRRRRRLEVLDLDKFPHSKIRIADVPGQETLEFGQLERSLPAFPASRLRSATTPISLCSRKPRQALQRTL